MNSTKRKVIDCFRLETNGNHLSFYIGCLANYQPEQYQVEKQKKQLEKALKMTISFHFFFFNSRM
ncbi:hypothetical protein [Bacillus carboniphilus]|uniref:hypothetical protein n=1 Tax=Bacillus carboniphilus TaxID=86663 RepID=UPI0035321A90